MKLAEELKTAAKLSIILPALAVAIVPYAIFRLIIMPFEKPVTADEVAALLRDCVNGTADDDEIDNFTSIKISDRRLTAIQAELRSLPDGDWTSDDAQKKLRELLTRVEAMSGTNIL